MHTDCFAYFTQDGNPDCSALELSKRKTKPYCGLTRYTCSFYKTDEQLKQEQERAKQINMQRK
jgi:hypothetical protein